MGETEYEGRGGREAGGLEGTWMPRGPVSLAGIPHGTGDATTGPLWNVWHIWFSPMSSTLQSTWDFEQASALSELCTHLSKNSGPILGDMEGSCCSDLLEL